VTGPQGSPSRHRTNGSSDRTTTTSTQHPIMNRSKAMNLMYEELARAHTTARLGEAQQRRRGHQLVKARRLSRRAELAAQQASLAIARSL
jgi:hypothetical protein